MTRQIKALFILPHYDFDDDEFFGIRDALEAKGVSTEIASTHLSEAQGRFRKIVSPEFLIQDVEADDYDTFIFIGGDGVEELYNDVDVQNLVNDALIAHKTVALVGQAVPILYYANVLRGRQVTTHEGLKQIIEEGGGFYTGTSMHQDGDIITGFDNRSVKDMADAILRSLDYEKEREANEHLGKQS